MKTINYYNKRLILTLMFATIIYLHSSIWRIGPLSDDFHHLYVNNEISIYDVLKYDTQINSNVYLYRPTTNLFFIIGNKLDSSFISLHIIQYSLFIISILLMFMIITHITNNQQLATGLTFLWAIIPNNIEVISWPAAIGDTIVIVCFLGCIYLFLQYIKSARTYLLAPIFVLIAIALLSKETGLLIPAFMTLWVLTKKIKGMKTYLPVIFSIPIIIYFINRLNYLRYIPNGSDKYYDGLMNSPIQIMKNIMISFSKMFVLPNNINDLKYEAILNVILIIIFIIFILIQTFRNSRDNDNLPLAISCLALLCGNIFLTALTPSPFDYYLYLSQTGLIIILSIIIKNYNIYLLLLTMLFIATFFISFSYSKIQTTVKASALGRAYISEDHQNPINRPIIYNLIYCRYWQYTRYIFPEEWQFTAAKYYYDRLKLNPEL